MLRFCCLILLLAIATTHSLPPDKVSPLHIIKTRSIDLNSAHGLAAETRLPNTVKPSAYRLDLEPYLEDGLFKGHVNINITWLQDSDEITFHCAHELEITTYEVQTICMKTYIVDKIAVKELLWDPKKPIATLRLERVVPKNTRGQVLFSFNGTMETSTTDGFFKTTYMEQETERIVAATQFRPNNARRMFPCFDEPAFKAEFELRVVRPKHMIALSNSPLVKTEEITGEPNAVWDHFKKTPPLSTFAFGFVIAELKQLGDTLNFTKRHIDTNETKAVDMRIWGRPEFHPALENLSEKLQKVFWALSDFWEVALPLDKVDIVALPNYQGVKPADSWGLIVFKESDLASKGYLQLAQELGYQYVGLLVTPEWWSDAHINKALVGYIAADIAFKIDGGSEMEGKWPMTILYSLYYEFSKRYPHSRITGMKQETASTKLELLFRTINYVFGDKAFKKGLRSFLYNRFFKTFNGNDIWKCIEEAAIIAKTKIVLGYKNHFEEPQDFVQQFAQSWIAKDRLPLVTVERNYENNSAVVTQKVYLRERPHDVPDASSMLWWIPLLFYNQREIDYASRVGYCKEWMNSYSHILLHMPDKDSFVIVNPEELVPYPVNYDERNWILLSKYLQGPNRLKIHELTRAKLLHDAWNLAYAGELSFKIAFNMTLFLKNERHHIVWDPVFTMIDHLSKQLDEPTNIKFQDYVIITLAPLYEELVKDEHEDEKNWQKKLRGHTKTFLCQAGYDPCVKEARAQFSKWMQAKNPDEGNPIANQYICPVFKYGNVSEWEFGLQRVLNFPPSRKPSERTYLLKTLAGCPISQDALKFQRLLNLSLLEGNGNFSETDLFLILSMASGSPYGRTQLFSFLQNHFATLKEKYQSRTNLWDNLINSATSQFTTKTGLDFVTKLYVDHQGEFGSAEHIIEKSIRNIKEEKMWSDQNLPVIKEWLDWFINVYNTSNEYLKNNAKN